jgi:hypothetical protein
VSAGLRVDHVARRRACNHPWPKRREYHISDVVRREPDLWLGQISLCGLERQQVDAGDAGQRGNDERPKWIAAHEDDVASSGSRCRKGQQIVICGPRHYDTAAQYQAVVTGTSASLRRDPT